MKCPKCKEEMVDISSRFIEKVGEVCDNKKCWFYGIDRMVD